MDIPNLPETQGATSAPAAEGAPAPKTAEDFFELMLDGAKEPVKVPVSKLPVDKLNPHLEKLRKEADRRMSEVDKRSKELSAREARYSSIDKLAEAIKGDPDKFLALGAELGLSEEQLYALSEKQVAARIRSQLREQEEQQDPSKKTAREKDERLAKLEDDNKKLQEERQKEERDRTRAGIEHVMVSALKTLEKLPKGLQLDAAREMVPILREAVDSDTELSPADLAKAALDALRKRAAFVYDDEETPLTEKQLERAKAILAKRADPPRPTHPAENGRGGGTVPKKPAAPGAPPAATDFLLKLIKAHPA